MQVAPKATPKAQDTNAGPHPPVTVEQVIEELRGPITALGPEYERDVRRLCLGWNPANSEFTEKLDLNDERYNPKHVQLTVVQAQYVRDSVADYDKALSSMVHPAYELLTSSTQEFFDSKQFTLAPPGETLPADEPDGDRGFYTRQFTMKILGWTCRVRFDSKNYPAFNDYLKEVAALKAKRLASLQHTLASF